MARIKPPHRRRILLELDLTEIPVEPDQDDPLARLRHRGRHDLRSTLRALHEAADDPRVVGLIARVGGPVPWPVMQELRAGVRAFAAGGKPTLAWAETFSEQPGAMAGYVLATAFDELWLQPGGELGLLGVALDTTFVRGSLDKLGLEPQFDQRHEYKNAADTIMRTEFTRAHRDRARPARRVGLRRRRRDHRAGSRTGPGEWSASWSTAGRGTAPRRATPDWSTGSAIATRPTRRSGRGSAASAELLFADRWRPRRRPHLPAPPPGSRRAGRRSGARSRQARSRRGADGSDQRAATRSAPPCARRPRTTGSRAVVLRVDSPGGSAVASETIWREVDACCEQGKPVVVSMGAVAASGGYYIACPADVIVALPATLTGSIGVFGGKFVVRELLERVGPDHRRRRARRARPDVLRPPRLRRGRERERLAASLDAIYDDFVAKVAPRPRPAARRDRGRRARPGVDRPRRRWTPAWSTSWAGSGTPCGSPAARAGLPDDAPVRPAIHLGPLARFGRPKNSADPRAGVRATLPGPADIAAVLGLPGTATLRMPALHLR